MVTALSSIAVNNMNKGERSNVDINRSEIKPVTSLDAANSHSASTSSTITNKSPTTTNSTAQQSPSVPAFRHKDEEKRIQMVIYFL